MGLAWVVRPCGGQAEARYRLRKRGGVQIDKRGIHLLRVSVQVGLHLGGGGLHRSHRVGHRVHEAGG